MGKHLPPVGCLRCVALCASALDLEIRDFFVFVDPERETLDANTKAFGGAERSYQHTLTSHFYWIHLKTSIKDCGRNF